MSQPPRASGKVYLVGAGPGDAGLITVRGVNCLKMADVVLCDYLVDPRILDNCGKDCEKVSLGSHSQGRMLEQEEINERMITAARSGQTVVRLKSGDPAVFGRLGEELKALCQANVPFEIVPGITAALAASSLAGLPITDRDSASAVALVTGHEKEGKHFSSLDFKALANFPGTLAIYMGTTTVDRWATALVEAGKAADTPALIVRRASFPDQATICCKLGEVIEAVNTPTKMRPPVVFIVGQVADPRNIQSWFENRPLFGQTIMICRPQHQSEQARAQFESLGAAVLVQPAIEISQPNDWTAVDQCLERLSHYDWLVFSSVNGVDFFIDRLFALGHDLRSLGSVKAAAIGQVTADRLREQGIIADLVPAEFRAEALANDLCAVAAGAKFLLLRASRGRELLRQELEQAGGIVEQVVVYQSTDVQQPAEKVLKMLEQGEVDWAIASSSAIARSMHVLFGSALQLTKIASISPVTSQTLRELGYEPVCEAREFTMQGVCAAIVAACGRDQ